MQKYIHKGCLFLLTILWSFSTYGQAGLDSDQHIDYVYVNACTKMIRGDLKNAMALFKEVVELKAENHAAWYQMAKISFSQREFEEAISYGEKAIALDPSNLWYKKILQQTFEYQGNYSQSVAYQEEIVDLNPESREEFLKLIELLDRNLEHKTALERIVNYGSRFGPDEKSLIKKFEILQKQNDPEKTLLALSNLILVNPFEPKYYRWKYDLHNSEGDYDQAVATLEDLLEKHPNNGFALLTLADYYKSISNIEKSDKYLFLAFQNEEVPVEGKLEVVNQMLDFIKIEPDLIPRIKRLSEIITTTHPGHSGTNLLKGHVFAIDNAPDSAAFYYRRVLEDTPTDIELWKRLLYISFRSKNYSALLRDAESAIELYPNQSELLYLYGVASAEMGENEAALYAFNKINRIAVGSDELLAQSFFEEGKVLNRLERFEEADKKFEASLEMRNEPKKNFLYAVILSKRGQKLDVARKLLLELIDNDPKNAEYAGVLGRVLFQIEKYTEAEEYLSKSLDLNPTSEFLEYHGDVLFKLGKKDAAISAWNKAIEMGAKQIDIERKVRQL